MTPPPSAMTRPPSAMTAMTAGTFLAAALCLVGAACAPRPSHEGDPRFSIPIYKVGAPYQVDGVVYHPRVDYDYEEEGVASWYGRDFHGRATANGEIFDTESLTAAHKTLPLPSYVEVTNLENGVKSILRVNDRGPFVKERLLDVSEAAAKALGFHRQGHARVNVRLLPERSRQAAFEMGARPRSQARGKPRPLGDIVAETYIPTPTVASAGVLRYVQVAALRDRERAELLRDTVRRLLAKEWLGEQVKVNLDSVPAGRGHVYRLRLGPVDEGEVAQMLLEGMIAYGFDDAFISLRHMRRPP